MGLLNFNGYLCETKQEYTTDYLTNLLIVILFEHNDE
jgi:hypothetical protein